MDKLGAILVKDNVGEKSESFLGVIKRAVWKPSTLRILRGELVEPIPGDELTPRSEGQKPYNYHWKKDPAVLLYCNEYDVAPLSDKEFILLEAIQTPAARYEMFISGEKLDWGCNLKPGDTVYVSIPSLAVFSSQRAAAVIRYVGGLPPEPGLMFGIEIMDQQYRGKGYTDGTFRGQRYFHCEDNCGLFMALNKLSPDSQGSSLTKEPRGGKSYAKVASHGTSHVVSRPGSKETCVDPRPHPPRFQKGERVVAFNKKGSRVHGTVRWVGRNTATQKHTVTIAGIETDVAVTVADFEGSMPGMTYLFSAAKKHHLFLPETEILSEEVATSASNSQQDKPHPPENIDVENTAALARKMGMGQQLQQLQQRLDSTAAENQQLRQRLHDAEQSKQSVLVENHQLQQRLQNAFAANEQSEQRLRSASAELQSLQDIDPWKVSRDKIECLTEIGVGGWGSVSKGTLQVAIKQLHPQILSQLYLDRLQREMQMLAQVRHPNLVQFIGVVLDEVALKLQASPMIITELLDMNLRKAYERKLDFNKLSIFQDVAQALNYLHERHDSIIHRDVSAPNVLLEALPNGTWRGKVSDLGSANLAKLAHTLAEGAIIYAAPETLPQFAHNPGSSPPRQTTKIDVYSYGILLCEVVTSRFPDPVQYQDMLGQVQRQWPLMHNLIVSCIQTNPGERPTMAEVLTKLSQTSQSEPTDPSGAQVLAAYTPTPQQGKVQHGELDVGVDSQKYQDKQEFDQVQKAVTEQIDVDEQIRRLEEIEQKRGKLNKPQQKAQQDAAASVNNLVPGTQPPHHGPGLPQSSQSAPPQPNPQPISSQELDPPHHDHFSADSVRAQMTVAYAPPPQQGVQLGELDVGSAVQISDPPRYGVIRWIGELPNIQGYVAGVELDEYMDGCTDGTWCEIRYFTCPYGRGFFCPYYNLLPKHRFHTSGNTRGIAPAVNPLVEYPMEERADQTLEHNQMVKYLGDERGIQGHQNSCYLDAIMFGLFALSDVFDSILLYEARDEAGEEIKSILWKGIVNPLRKNGVVRYESVMMLRNKLEEVGKKKGVYQDEKDPEEFLNLLFKHILNVEPFVHIKRPYGVEPEYFVQLFVDYDESLKLPTVGDLMKKMFREQDITFTEVPSKLLIQVPRFGKQYKTYQKIIPAAKLNVADLIVSPYQCFICEKSAWKQCSACVHKYRSEKRTAGGVVYFCDSCSRTFHSPKSRSNHDVQNVLQPPEVADLSELDLLSVICIETSHYVCFVHWENQWIFFDSMANRVYDMYSIPKGVDCTQDLNEWVYSDDDHQRLLDTPPRELPEYVRRFTQDLYMCVYINPDAGMYI